MASEFDVFAIGDFEQRNGDSDGSIAACGNATMMNFGVGAAVGRGAEGLVVDGDLNFGFGTIYGDAIVGGTVNLTNAGFAGGGRVRRGGAAACAGAAAGLRNLCSSLQSLPATGATRNQYGIVRVTGMDPVRNVFDVESAQLAVANTIEVDVPPGATAIVNVRGARASLRHLGFLMHDAGKVLYTFCDATDVDLNGVGVQGSILAPQAAVAFSNGMFVGQLAAGSVYGSGSFGVARFEGCLPLRLRSQTAEQKGRAQGGRAQSDGAAERLQGYGRRLERRHPGS